jgi:hypothetical protein
MKYAVVKILMAGGMGVVILHGALEGDELGTLADQMGDLPIIVTTSASTDTGYAMMPSAVVEAFFRIPRPFDVAPIPSSFPVIRATKKST